MKITITHNGFHGLITVSFLAPDNTAAGDQVEVSASVARRLNSAVCGCSDCRCGEQVACPDGFGTNARWWVTLPATGEMSGNYPQQR